MTAPFVQLALEVLGRTDVPPTTKLVYAAILAAAWQDPDCYRSESSLGELAGVSVRSVRRSIVQLRAIGWVKVARAGGKQHRYLITGPRVGGATPPRSRGGPDPGGGPTPAKSAGVNGQTHASLAAPHASLAGVSGQKRIATPAILASNEDPKTNTPTKDSQQRRTMQPLNTDKQGGKAGSEGSEPGLSKRQEIARHIEATGGVRW